MLRLCEDNLLKNTHEMAIFKSRWMESYLVNSLICDETYSSSNYQPFKLPALQTTSPSNYQPFKLPALQIV